MAVAAIAPSVKNDLKGSQEYEEWKRNNLKDTLRKTNKNPTLMCQDCKTEILSNVRTCPYCGSGNVIQVLKKKNPSKTKKLQSVKLELKCPVCGDLFHSEKELLEHYDKTHLPKIRKIVKQQSSNSPDITSNERLKCTDCKSEILASDVSRCPYCGSTRIEKS